MMPFNPQEAFAMPEKSNSLSGDILGVPICEKGIIPNESLGLDTPRGK